MNRRTAVLNFACLSAGSFLLPAYLKKPGNPVHSLTKSGLSLKNMHLSSTQETLMAELTKTILPANYRSGAKAHLFALCMIDQRFKQEDQRQFMDGLDQFDAIARKQDGISFAEFSPERKVEFLRELEQTETFQGNVGAFYRVTRRLIVQSINNGQESPTNVSGFFPQVYSTQI